MSFARHAQGWLAGACLAFGLFPAAAQQPEFRALWADTFHAGMRTSAEVSALVYTARDNNFNAIIVEVRKRGDAYYNSTIEPKASDVSPQSFDPLADLLTKALVDRAEQLKHRSYFVRFRAQNIAGWALLLCREAASLRRRRPTSTNGATRSRRK